MARSDVTSVQTQLLGREVSFNVSQSWLAYWLVILRLAVGWWMLHAGLDKLANWPFDASWFVGGADPRLSDLPLPGTSVGVPPW